MQSEYIKYKFVHVLNENRKSFFKLNQNAMNSGWLDAAATYGWEQEKLGVLSDILTYRQVV